MPIDILRELGEAFRIKIIYRPDGRKAQFSAEVPAKTIGEQADLVDRRAQICCVDPTSQNANSRVMVEGFPVAVAVSRAKLRRGGYSRAGGRHEILFIDRSPEDTFVIPPPSDSLADPRIEA